MINWIKYDPENPPEIGKDYLVSDGPNVEKAYYQKFSDDDPPRWYPPDLSSIDEPDVIYYCPINLPGEETTE